MLRAATPSSVDPLVQIDKKGIIKMVNHACCRVFQYGESDLIGQNVKLLMPQKYAIKHDSFLSDYLKTGVKKVIGTGRKLHGSRKDGSTLMILLSIVHGLMTKKYVRRQFPNFVFSKSVKKISE